MLKLQLQYFVHLLQKPNSLEKPWYWERLKAEGGGDDRGRDGWMASLTQWTWVSVNSGSWWWTGRPACCGPWGCKESDPTEWLNWTELNVRMRKSIPMQADEKPWVHEEERGVWGSRGGNRVQELSRRKKGQTSFFFPSKFLILSLIKCFFSTVCCDPHSQRLWHSQ